MDLLFLKRNYQINTKSVFLFVIAATLFISTPFLVFSDDFRVDQWQKTEFIWNFGIISSCNKGVPPSPIQFFSGPPTFQPKYYKNIKTGDLVWVRCEFLPQFYRLILPKVSSSFILVVADGDETFPYQSGLAPSEIEELLRSEKIIHIFAQNMDNRKKNAKLTHLPIGIDFHTIGYKSKDGSWGEKGEPLLQELRLKRLLSKLKPTYKRKCRAFVDFQHSDTMRAGLSRYLEFGEDRTMIFNRLKETGLIDYSDRMSRYKLWETKGAYMFSICPLGNGLDTHRVWEDLVLGCIVIVKTSPLDELYQGMPVVIVSDWSEVTRENLDQWAKQFSDAFTNPDYRKKLSTDYWLKKIHSKFRGKLN